MSHKELKKFSDEELEREIQRRKNICYKSPKGLWEVTTEGDCEGKTTLHLGVYKGHVVDIALRLANKSYYGLHFKPAEEIPEEPTRESVHISLGYDSGVSKIEKNSRLKKVDEWMRKEDSRFDYQLKNSNYHTSFVISYKK